MKEIKVLKMNGCKFVHRICIHYYYYYYLLKSSSSEVCEQTTTVISIYFWVAFEVTQLSSAIHDFPCYNYLSVLVPGFDCSLDLTEIGILKKLLTY